MGKRKLESNGAGRTAKKLKEDQKEKFRSGLFDSTEFEKNRSSYANSQP
jgi:hypothetical protein